MKKGATLDSTKEHELNSITEFGFDVTMKFKEGSRFKDMTINNVTEVHHLYKDILSGDRIAFESDIHSTGFSELVDTIKEVVIKLATTKKENFIEV